MECYFNTNFFYFSTLILITIHYFSTNLGTVDGEVAGTVQGDEEVRNSNYDVHLFPPNMVLVLT